ncbi:MAG: hypothetical protein U1F08_11585 [Steroidobacteraceae bacterium]
MPRLDRRYALAQARLQARHGRRPADADWAALAATRDLDTTLALLADWPVAGWTRRLGRRPAPADVERQARQAWLDEVREVARWLPAPDRPVVEWLGWLPWVPALEKLARGGRAPDWARDDPLLGPVVASDLPARATALGRTGLAPLAAGFDPGGSPAAVWYAHWVALWPPRRAVRAPLEAVSLELRRAIGRLAALPPEVGSDAVARDLGRRLEFAFRRHPLAPAGVVAWLGLRALAWRRLRGALVTRALAVEAAA